jgi:iron complex outermembrane receptor protein
MRPLDRIQIGHQALSLLLGIGAAECAFGESSEALFGLPETVTIATGRQQSIRTAPAVATVITAEDIRNFGIRNVVEALRLVPGIHQSWYTNYYPDLTVRGFSSLRSNNVLFLLDGIPQTELFDGDQISVMGTIPIDAIERIEVTRGPGSSVFGADAFSAVVNVITRRKAEGARIALSGGSFDTANARLLTGKNWDGVSVVLALEGMETDDHSPWLQLDRQSTIDSLLGTSASLAPAHLNTSRNEQGALLNLSVGDTTGMLRASRWNDRGLGAGIGTSIDPLGTLSFDTLEGRLAHRIDLGSDWDLILTANAARTTRTLDNILLFPPGAFNFFTEGASLSTEIEQERLRLQADVRYDGFERHFLAAGVGYEHVGFNVDSATLNYLIIDDFVVPTAATTYTDTGDLDDYSRKLLYAYVQDEWFFAPKWSLTWGVRVDDYSDFGTQVSPRAVLVWTPRPEWTAKLLYGEGFRAPTLLETTRFPIPIYRPTPDLKAERLRTVELALDYTPRANLTFGINAFRHETTDQIRQQDRGTFLQPENVGRQVGQGVELEMRWRITPDLLFRGWYAYQYNTDETTGRDAGFSPHHRLFASLQYAWGKAFFNLQGTYVGDRARVAEDFRDEPDEYGQLDLLARYQLTKRLSVQLDVRNLLNANIEEASPGTNLPVDLPLPGRNYYFTLDMAF